MKKEVTKEDLRIGDRVEMVNCREAEKYKGTVWEVESEPWDLCGSEVVLLCGYRGGFSTKMLRKVNGRSI